MLMTRELVLSIIQREFPSEDAEAIAGLLDRYGTEPYERERERVQLAILKLSQGEREKLLYWIDIAKQDYRDALAGAEYPAELQSPFNLSPDHQKSVLEQDRKQYLQWLRGEPNPGQPDTTGNGS